MEKKTWLRLIGSLAGIASLLWVVNLAVAGESQFVYQIEWHSLSSAVILQSLAVLLTGFAWVAVIRKLFPTQIFLSSLLVPAHIFAWFLRYLPGQVGSAISKSATLSKYSIGAKTTVTIFLMENLGLQLSAVTLGLWLSFNYSWALSAFLCLAAVALLALGFRWGKGAISKRSKHRNKLERVFLRLTGLEMGTLRGLVLPGSHWALYVCSRCLTAVSFIILGSSLLGEFSLDVFAIAGAALISGVIGVLVPFVPSGLGVREASFVVLAMHFAPEEVLAQFAILSRMAMLLADLLLFLSALMFRTVISKSTSA